MSEEGAGFGSMHDNVIQEEGMLECDHVDVEQVHRIARSLLLTLSTACVEKTYGDLFKSPLSVAHDVKKEMLDYVNQQSQSYESSQSGANGVGGPLRAAMEIVEELLDNFVRSKTNFLSRVSSKLISSESKEDRIEDLVHELDRIGAWMVDQRQMLAKALLRRSDRFGSSNCGMKFGTSEMLAHHKGMCPLRPITCANEGCGYVFSALHVVDHEAICTFKLLPCEQECGVLIMRNSMDKHCVTVCAMKLVNCPFFQVGCKNKLPQKTLEQHCTDSMGSHLISVLQDLQKQEILVSSLTQRILLLEKALSISQRSEAVDIGTLSLTIRQQDAKIKALEQETSRLRQDVKAASTSAEVFQLRRQLQSLQKNES